MLVEQETWRIRKGEKLERNLTITINALPQGVALLSTACLCVFQKQAEGMAQLREMAGNKSHS